MNETAILPPADPALTSDEPPDTRLGEWRASASPVYCRDRAGRILVVNPAFTRKFRRGANDLAGTPVAALLHPDDLPAFTATAARLGAPSSETARTHRWLTQQGWRWYIWEETPLPDAAGEVPMVRAVGRDVTRQRLAEELYLKLSRAVDQSPVSIVITDPGGRVQYVNPKFIEVSGHSLEDILDRDLPILREGHPTEESYQQFFATVRSGQEWRGELSRSQPDGSLKWESIQVTCLRNTAGEITNFLCMREDITDRRQLQEELRQAQKMESLGTLAGGIAHDFNNILAVISGYADITLLHPQDGTMFQKSLREIQRAVQRASGLVRQILTFSRKGEVNFAPLDLNLLVRELAALLSETFPRAVNFSLALEEGLPPLIADQNQLQQIVLNLCVNARDAMPTGGALTVSTSSNAGESLANSKAVRGQKYACLSVHDTGTGMTPEVRARIFDPFFTTKQVNQGTGLGLAVVYGIVASHQGFIDVDSALGQGSTFSIYLPATETKPAAAPAIASGDFPGGGESLLVVDDEDPLRKLLQAALTRKGYKVACACDGLEAIDLIYNQDYAIDAVLLDLNMPGASGSEVLSVIKKQRPLLKVLMLSGHLTAEARVDLEKLGQKEFLNKPYSLGDLGRRLRKLLDEAAPPAGSV